MSCNKVSGVQDVLTNTDVGGCMFTDRKRQINGPQGRRKEFFQALQLLFPNSASGIARTLLPFLLYIFKFPDSRCRPLVSLSDNLNPFQRYRGGKA